MRGQRLIQKFTEEELTELFTALESKQERPTAESFEKWISRWEGFVREVEELPGYRHLTYEFFNDISIREILFESLQILRPQLRSKAEAVLQPLDERFLKATQRVEKAPFWDGIDPSRWWNFCLPKRLSPEAREEWESYFQGSNYVFEGAK